jgi:hypothetical protein
MSLRITIDIFSGRECPVIELSGKEAQEALSRLHPERMLEKGEPALPPSPTLGYRGLIVEQTGTLAKGLPKIMRLAHGDMFGEGLMHRAADETFENFIIGSKALETPELGTEFTGYLKKEIARFRDVRKALTAVQVVVPPVTILKTCPCAPLYEPAWWNDGGQKQQHNNCYNYSTNYRTDTFAQPGLAAGAKYTALTCAKVKPAAVADCLEDSPNADNQCPEEGHLVALVVAPGMDYHWYRKGRNTYWSHKPGPGAVTNLDNSGHSIPDPRTANRGPYTNFCTFMVVKHGHIKIK